VLAVNEAGSADVISAGGPTDTRSSALQFAAADAPSRGSHGPPRKAAADRTNLLLYGAGDQRSRCSSPQLVICSEQREQDADDGDEENEDDSDCSGADVEGRASPRRCSSSVVDLRRAAAATAAAGDSGSSLDNVHFDVMPPPCSRCHRPGSRNKRRAKCVQLCVPTVMPAPRRPAAGAAADNAAPRTTQYDRLAPHHAALTTRRDRYGPTLPLSFCNSSTPVGRVGSRCRSRIIETSV